MFHFQENTVQMQQLILEIAKPILEDFKNNPIGSLIAIRFIKDCLACDQEKFARFLLENKFDEIIYKIALFDKENKVDSSFFYRVGFESRRKTFWRFKGSEITRKKLLDLNIRMHLHVG